MILTLTIQDNAATLSLFFKAAVSFTINIPIWTTLALSGQLPAVRMFDIHVTFVHFKFYLWTFQDYQRQLLSANWLPKLPQFQKLQLETQNQVQRKLLLQNRITKMPVRKLQPKEHQRCQSQRMWLKFHPHWKRKSLATRDGPRALRSKEVPQVGFKVQDLIINSPL